MKDSSAAYRELYQANTFYKEKKGIILTSCQRLKARVVRICTSIAYAVQDI